MRSLGQSPHESRQSPVKVWEQQNRIAALVNDYTHSHTTIVSLVGYKCISCKEEIGGIRYPGNIAEFKQNILSTVVAERTVQIRHATELVPTV